VEVFYDYKSFENIKNFLNKYSLNILDNRSDYRPERHDNPKWPGEHYIDENGYLTSKILYPQELQILDQQDFSYKLNYNGFRSQHFKELNNNDINILYAGCSFTFGEGLPYEFTWTTLLTNKIKDFYKNKNIEAYNVGYMGSSIHLVIRNVMAFIRNFGKPDYIFINFPDIARNINYCDRLNRYEKVFYSKRHFENKMNPIQLQYTKNFVIEDSILLAVDLINMLEDYCESNNIKLIWTTWFYSLVPMYESLNFKYFMTPDTTFQTHRLSETITEKNPYYKNINNLPYWEIARDKNHPGTAWTTHISDLIYNDFIKRHDIGGIWNEKNN
jgi:hypothetical protein